MQDFKIEPLGGAPALKLPAFTPTLKILLIAVGLILLGAAGFLLFGRVPFAERQVSLTMDHPGEISSGDRVVFTVRYQNDNRAALTNAKLTFYAPPEAIFLKEGKVTAQVSDSIDLGTIEGNGKGEKTFELLVIGAQGNVKTAKAMLSYQPDSLTTKLQKTAEGAVTILRLPIQLTAVAPPTVLNGQTLTYLIDYRNQTQTVFSNLRMRVRVPEGFTVTSVTPKGSFPGDRDGEWVWNISTLDPGDGARITLQGTVQGRERETKTLAVNLQHLFDPLAPDGQSTDPIYVDLEKAEASSVIATPLLSAGVTVQDVTEYTAHVQDNLKYKILVANNSDVDLSSLTLTAKLEGSMYDLATINALGAFDGPTRTVLWNSAVVPELGILRAHQSVMVSLTVRLKSAFPSTIGTGGSLLKISVHVETVNVPDVFQVDALSADDALITRISTAMAFNQNIVGSEPKVDQRSVSTVRWTLANPSNEITQAKITAVLLPGVSWENIADIQGTQARPRYDARTSTITWDVGVLPGGVGVVFPAMELNFQIGFTPSVNQAGGTVPLIKDIRFEGTDSLTKEKIITTAPNISSGSVQP